MALSTSSTVPVSQARALAEIGSSGTRGPEAIFKYLNYLFAQKYGALIMDWTGGTQRFGTGTTPSGDVKWRAKTQPYANFSGSNAVADVYVYHVQSVTTGTWSLRVTAPGGATLTTDMATLGTSAGEWETIGQIQYDDTAAFGDWELQEVSATGLAGDRYILGVMIMPNRGLLPAVTGGYGGAADECYPFDSAVAWATSGALHSLLLRYGHHLARYLFEHRTAGQILSCGIDSHTYTGGGADQTMTETVHVVPERVTSVNVWVLSFKNTGAGTAKLYLNGDLVDSDTLTDANDSWTTLTATVEPGSTIVLRVDVDRDIYSVCGAWADAEL